MNRKTGEEKGNHQGSYEGVVKLLGKSQLPQEFITVGRSFDDALGRCVLRDDNQRNAVILYKAQLELFEMWDEIGDLISWLNASAAVGGFNRSLAAMTYTGIYVPEGAGIKLHKDNQKALMELQKIKAAGHSDKQQNEQEQR